MNRNKKIIAITMSGLICSSSLFTTISLADSNSNKKEEVIYVNLDNSGKIDNIYAVNIFNGKEITDYGSYKEVKNMNTSDQINYSNGVIKINNSSDKLYYEGVMYEDTQIPWDISIKYILDGKEYSGNEIAGKSGDLKIKISIKENKKSKNTFFDNYALQTSLQLDTNLCRNIESDGATIANVGGLKQLTYTILPGKEKDITISADVVDFEMGAISINGTKLNLGLDNDSIDTSELTDKLSQLQDSVSELDNGANNLSNGAGQLNDGTKALSDGINTIQDALDALNSKSSDLTGGSSEVYEALTTIQSALKNVKFAANDLTKLSDASTTIQSGIDNLVGGLKSVDSSIDSYYSALSKAGLSDVNDLISKNNKAMNNLKITKTQRDLYAAYVSGGTSGATKKLGELAQSGDAEAVALYQQVSAGNTGAVTNYITQAGTLISIESLLKANTAYIQGSDKLISGIDSSLNPSSSKNNLMTGALKLQSSYKEFDSSIQDLVSSLGNLMTNMTSLKSGINKLVENYSVLDKGINNYTDAVSKISEGYNEICLGALDLVSGTSTLYDGTKTLVEGTGEFSDKTQNLDGKVDDEINSMIDEFTGSDFKTESFVSDKNKNVDLVQFAIKTPAIESEEEEAEETIEKESLTVWQKILRLFNLY